MFSVYLRGTALALVMSVFSLAIDAQASGLIRSTTSVGTAGGPGVSAGLNANTNVLSTQTTTSTTPGIAHRSRTHTSVDTDGSIARTRQDSDAVYDNEGHTVIRTRTHVRNENPVESRVYESARVSTDIDADADAGLYICGSGAIHTGGNFND